MKKIFLVFLVLFCAFFGVQVSEAQDIYAARVYYTDGYSEDIYDFLVGDDMAWLLVYQGDTEYNLDLSLLRRVKFIEQEKITWTDGRTGWRDTVRITFRNGQEGIYDLYDADADPLYFTGYDAYGNYWYDYWGEIDEIEFL